MPRNDGSRWGTQGSRHRDRDYRDTSRRSTHDPRARVRDPRSRLSTADGSWGSSRERESQPRNDSRQAPKHPMIARAPVYKFALKNTESIDLKHSIKKVPIDSMPIQDVWNHLKDWQAKVAYHSADELREVLQKKRKVPETILAAMLRLGVLRTPVPGLEKFVPPIGGGPVAAPGRHGSDTRAVDHQYPHEHHYPQSSSSSARVVDPRRKRARDDPPLDPRKR